MGIDIYMVWKNQTEPEKQAQYTGFNVNAGNTGYLREAYHGEPYATMFLLKEAFEDEEGTARIPARLLRDRLPHTIVLARERCEKVYSKKVDIHDPLIQSYIDFVELAEKKEQETGEPVVIHASY